MIQITKKMSFVLAVAFAASAVISGCGKNTPLPQIMVGDSGANNIEDEPVDETENLEETEEEQPTDIIDYSNLSINEAETAEEPVIAEVAEDSLLRTEDGKIIVDLIMFMGQSNMAGTGGDASKAPSVPQDHGYEFRAISDPTRLYPISEPFGVNENNTNAIYDAPGSKKGSLVSSFVNEYYDETGIPVVAVSASSGGKDTDFWLKPNVVSDYSERQKRAQVWLESNNYHIRKQYVIWLQGESDAMMETTSEEYKINMDNIIRPLFIGGVQKVFIITPGRTIDTKDFFKDITSAQIELCRNSGYYALATTALYEVSTEYMKDIFHYNQSVLNYIGADAAKSVAFYSNNTKEMCLYDYINKTTYIPDGYDYDGSEKVEPFDINGSNVLTRYE